jgi:hypothetical protein
MSLINSIQQGPKDLYQKIDNNPGKVAIAAGTLGVAAAVTAGLIATVATPALAVLGGLAILLAIYQGAKAYTLRNQVEALSTSVEKSSNNKEEDFSKTLVEYKDANQIKQEKQNLARTQFLAGKQLRESEKKALNSYEFEFKEERFNWKKAAKAAALATAIAGTGYAAYAYGPTAIANLAPVKDAAMAKLAVAAEHASHAVAAASRYASTLITKA